ncbi:hypothetical protein BpHYR1_031686, partial [Brachionus plicatilis]
LNPLLKDNGKILQLLVNTCKHCIEYGLSEKLHTVITDNAIMYVAFDEVSLSGFNANLDDI